MGQTLITAPDPGVDAQDPPISFLLWDNTQQQQNAFMQGQMPMLWSLVAIHEMGHSRANLRELEIGTNSDYHRWPGSDRTGMACVMNRFDQIGSWGMSADSQRALIFDQLRFCGEARDRTHIPPIQSCFRYLDQRVKGAP